MSFEGGDDLSYPIPPIPAPSPPRRRGAGVVAAGIVVGVVGVMAIAPAFVRLPYVIVAPGNATPVADVVRIADAHTYRHRGSLLFLTVSVSNQRPNLYRFAHAWLDDDVEILDEKDVCGSQSRSQCEEENLRLMEESQLTAKKVALERLGYSVPVHGDGASVAAVDSKSPAHGRLRQGDVITGADGKPVHLADELGPIVRQREAGRPVTLTVVRGGAERSLTMTTGWSHQTHQGLSCSATRRQSGQACLGVASFTKNLKVDFPVDVKIDPGDVSGPSAGLAFTLTIINRLTPGDITGGRQVAVTGEIEPDGSVAEVGGVAQKAITARRAGATLMLTPVAEVKEARKHAGRMQVVGVDTLDDALAALHRAGGAALASRDQLHPAA